jgi:mono/diheme cytochrome c family protein
MQTQWARTPFFIAASLLAAGAARGQDIQNGRGIAELWCSDCHLVDPQERKSGRDSAPTFLSIARMKSTTETSLAAFLSIPHGGGGRMPDLVLNRNEIQDVSAYILSLRRLP